LKVVVLDTDLGLGIVQLMGEGTPEPDIDEAEFDEVNALTYEDLIADPNQMINLKPVSYHSEFLNPI
jgi:hypothetical protein